MKLVSLYIENFGGLSRYSLDFEDGLTVIEEANGFGKTTLAEFIRAMFYGFPRKSKTLDKSRRQKYTPWNGGKFGGNLVFEADGSRYRIERSFGATPKGDSFSLIDLATGRKSDRYSEEIGLELFRLDGDSFERSTYLPQLSDGTVLTTDSIRSKLSNLVEDTNDVGNFEKAVAALKSKRSTFVPYRGSGGSVMQAHSRVSQLQEQLKMAESQRVGLEECNENIGKLQVQQERLEAQREQVRREIRRASEAAAAAAVHQQHRRLAGQLEEVRNTCAALRERYPVGIPEPAKIEAARNAAAQLEILDGRTVTEPEDLEAALLVENGRRRFGDRTPTREELEECRSRCSAYLALRTEAENKAVSREKWEQYQNLEALEKTGALEPARLDELTEASRELEKKRHELGHLVPAAEDESRFSELEAYFAPGIPDEDTLQLHRQELEQLQKLQQENTELASAAAQRPVAKANPLPLVLLLLLGAAATVVGIVLLVRQEFLWGGIALGAGVLALIGAVFAGVRLMLTRELGAAVLLEQEKLRANEEMIGALREKLEAFTAPYTAEAPLSAALYELQDNREDYLALQARIGSVCEKRLMLENRIREQENWLRGQLGEGSYDDRILELRLEREQLLHLRQELLTAREEISRRTEQSEELKKQITDFLGIYGAAETEDFHSAVSELERSSEAYIRAARRVQQWQQEKRHHEQELARWHGELARFFAEASLNAEADVSRQLLTIRDHRKEWEEAAREARELDRELKEFRAANSQRLAEPVPEVLQPAQELQQQEKELTAQLSGVSDLLLRSRQQREVLQSQVQQIPAIRDELQHWQEKRAADQKRSDLLDDTLRLLEQAKENLSGSYLGPIRSSFASYLERLWGRSEEQILVTPDLDVQLERFGEARALGYFSAGQMDAVMLCMRLALVDALFAQEKPFVILDDPFVNLDDACTAQALELLQTLAKDRQILYLTCNSSRTPK